MSETTAPPATLEFTSVARGAAPGVLSGSAYRARGLQPGVHRGLPSTTLTMIFSLDGPVVGASEDTVGRAPAGPRADLVLAGLHTEPVLVEQPARQEGIQLQLDPLAARALFRVRAADLVDGFDGTEVLGRAGRDLWEQVAGSAEGPQRLARIARAFRARCCGAPTGAGQVRPEVAEAWRLVLASRGRISMDVLASRVSLSPRRLRTEFSREFGLGPKSAARLARFEAALDAIAGTVHAGRPPDLADVAAATGYADQAHLTREFRGFTGTSPGRWIREERRNLLAGGHGTAEDRAMDTTSSPPPRVGVFPAFQAHDARAEIRFLCDVLGFVETLVVPGDGETIAHAQLDWPGGGAVMLGTHRPAGEYRREPGTLGAYLVIDDVGLDALVERAQRSGARIVQPLRSPPHGGRDITIASPEGNLWSIGTYPGEPAGGAR